MRTGCYYTGQKGYLNNVHYSQYMFINKQQQKSTIHIFTFTLQFTYKKKKTQRYNEKR